MVQKLFLSVQRYGHFHLVVTILVFFFWNCMDKYQDYRQIREKPSIIVQNGTSQTKNGSLIRGGQRTVFYLDPLKICERVML